MTKESMRTGLAASETGLKLVTVYSETAGSKLLRDHLQFLREQQPDSLILVQTPRITSPELEAIFEAGANAFRIAEKEEPSDSS